MLWLAGHRLAAVLTLAVMIGGAALSAMLDVPLPDGSGLLFVGAILLAGADAANRDNWMTHEEETHRAAGRFDWADFYERLRHSKVRWYLLAGALTFVAGLVQLILSLFD